jgi:hypothetical protein
MPPKTVICGICKAHLGQAATRDAELVAFIAHCRVSHPAAYDEMAEAYDRASKDLPSKRQTIR